MNKCLPDVASNDASIHALPLSWVGMQHIDLPLTLDEPDASHPVHADAEVYVDLPDEGIKGIHMSRLYTLLDQFSENAKLNAESLKLLLQKIIESHIDCHSTSARVAFAFDALRRRPALVSENLGGWRKYPARVEAQLDQTGMQIKVVVKVLYASTCPCSAALSRQILEQAFTAEFGAHSAIDATDVAKWLSVHASIATPHSQRSEATVTLAVEPDEALGIFDLIDQIETVLGTPVQTAVKRADEQEFAKRNGSNLMYVEDAARKIRAALLTHNKQADVQVRHLESLHPHDAVAISAHGREGACDLTVHNKITTEVTA
ncbi:GTP cyclohydrolase FolE2 [Herminiimonas aquatilis]|uniref:GTP cyclohydrolase FolE2 n=1 Tax=Herminiimonas aquatilis TaxID=345342 RepID=A0ABW2J7R6_9BURK